MLDEIAFLVISAVTIVAALKVVSSEELVHAAIYLGLVLLGVAGVYLTIGAEFLAAVQILIYVGAVTTLILFAVMLTTHASPMEGFAEDRTPLSTLGVDAPPGMDVEAVEEVPEDVETVDEAEQEADRTGEGYTVTKQGVEDDASAETEAETESGTDADEGSADEEPEPAGTESPEAEDGADEADAEDEPTDEEAEEER